MNAVTQSATLPAKQYASREPLPEAWIDRLFSRLHAMYGSKFAAMWQGTDPHEVKAVWAEELAGFREMPECLKAALQSFNESEWPPTLPQFLKACREAARRTEKPVLSLVAPKADPAKAEERLAVINAAIGRMTK